MKNNKRVHSKLRVVLSIMSCLVIGIFGSASAFAATGEIPDKGWDLYSGDELSGNEQFNAIIPTVDGGNVSLEEHEDQGIVVKTDAGGNVVWRAPIASNRPVSVSSVTEMSDGSILIAGYTDASATGDISEVNHGGQDGLLIKYNSKGQKIWSKLIGGSGNDYFQKVIATTDGGFLAAGSSQSTKSGSITDNSNGGDGDGYIVKFDQAGNVQWDNLFGSAYFDLFNSVVQTSDGAFIAVGNITIPGGISNLGGEVTAVVPESFVGDIRCGLAVKFDQTGKMVWNRIYSTGNGNHDFSGIVATPNGGCVVVGSAINWSGDIGPWEPLANSQFGLALKYDNVGAVQWEMANTQANSFSDVVAGKNGEIFAAGLKYPNPADDVFSSLHPKGVVVSISETGSFVESAYFKRGSLFDGGTVFSGIAIDKRGFLTVAGNSNNIITGTLNVYQKDGLIIHFGESLCDITFQVDGGSAIPDQTINYNGVITPPADPTKAGYIFQGWFANSILSERFPMNERVLHNNTAYARWYIHVALQNIFSDAKRVTGTGQPNLSIMVSMPDGGKLHTTVGTNGKWSVELPKSYKLNEGQKVMANMYENDNAGVPISTAESVIIKAVLPPVTGDTGRAVPIALFFIALSYIIMIRVLKVPQKKR